MRTSSNRSDDTPTLLSNYKQFAPRLTFNLPWRGFEMLFDGVAANNANHPQTNERERKVRTGTGLWVMSFKIAPAYARVDEAVFATP